MHKFILYFAVIFMASACSQPPAEIKYNVFEAAERESKWYSGNKPAIKSAKIAPILTAPTSRKILTSKLITVKSGDTLYSIARNYGVSRTSLISLNGLQYPYKLFVGQKLKVSGTAYASEGAKKLKINTANYKNHKVKKGETVYSIARKYNTTKDVIVQTNNIRQPYALMAGQNLKVPSAKAQPKKPSNKTYASKAPERQTKKSSPKKPIYKKEKAKYKKGRTSSKGFQWPVKGRVISSFGGKASGVKNDGINIAAKAGASVTTAAKGKVAFIGNELKGYGNLVIIRHSKGVLTAYAHLDRVVVKKNQKLKTGQVIGYVGQTGSADKPQLHFAVRKGRTPINPKSYLP